MGAANGDVYLFEKSDEPRELYRRSRVVKIAQNASRIRSMAISPQEDTVVCVQDNSQIYKLNINTNESLKVRKPPPSPSARPGPPDRAAVI